MEHREPNPATYLAAVLATEPAPGGGAPIGNPSYRAARDAESLVRLGKRAAKIAVDRCNGIQRYDAAARQMLATWTEADESRADKACDKIAKDAAAILLPYGATKISVGGDPRGFTLKFHLASGRSNSAGGEGWGV
jgi:hypothetical protein